MQAPLLCDLAMNYPMAPGQAEAVAEAVQAAARHRPDALPAVVAAGRPGLAEALAGAPPGTCAGSGPDMAMLPGGQAALASALRVALASAPPGRRAAIVEQYTFPRALQVLQSQAAPVLGVACDEAGPLPDALLALAQGEQRPAVLYLMPAVHNPLGHSHTQARREAIARIAEDQDLWIVEDQAYAFLDGSAPACASYARLLPQRSLQVHSLSKLADPAIQLGALIHPPALATAVAHDMGVQGSHASPYLAAAAMALAADGTLARLAAAKRAEGLRRRQAAHQALGQACEGPGHAWHVWLQTPAGTSGLAFAARARDAGVLVSAGAFYHHAGRDCPNVRVSLGGEACPDRLHAGLDRLAGLLGG